MSSVIEKVQKSMSDNGEKTAMAYFYCDYRDEAKQDSTMILKSLIRQFARQNDDCFERLEEFYEAHYSEEKGEKGAIFTSEDLISLLHSMTEDLSDALIIVDGLDECLANRGLVTKLLKSLNVPGGSRVKTLFASRDEADIRAQLRDYAIVEMAVNNSDIARFVESELKIKEWAKALPAKEKEKIKESLIGPAAGM